MSVNAKVRWTGLDEFLRDLGSLPETLRSDGMQIVREETEGAAIEISQQYARKTGRLARLVRTFYPSSTILVGLVKSTAPHAHLYEFGTKARKNAKGANRGTMPDKEVTVPIARRRRARMARRLVELLQKNGFNISHA